jgi:hypothetical protein
MLRKAKVCVLVRLLLERFGGHAAAHLAPESEQNGEAREVKNSFSETNPMQRAVSGPQKRTKRRTQDGRKSFYA